MYKIKKNRTPLRMLALHSYFFSRKYPAIFFLCKWTIISSAIGVLSGSASAFFLYTLQKCTDFRELHPMLIVLLPFAGLVICFIYTKWGKEVVGGNNVLISAALHPQKNVVPFKMAPIVYFTTIITHLFGGSAGREGTALQMSGAISAKLGGVFKLSNKEKQMLMAAAVAAGFGSVFGTPLAGAVFALEVFVIGAVRYSALFPVFVASVIADFVTKKWQIAHTHYSIGEMPENSLQVIFYSLLAGVFFGIAAIVFCKGMHWLGNTSKKILPNAYKRVFIGGSLIAVAVFLLGSTKYIGLGVPTIVQSFSVLLPPYDFLLKLIFTIVTLSVGYKGGEVTPLFFIGATLGNALSYFIPLPIGLLAGMGFVAVFAGATNTPLACSLMAIELFGIDCGIYSTIACVVAYQVSGHGSIYGGQLIGQSKNSGRQHLEGKHAMDDL